MSEHDYKIKQFDHIGITVSDIQRASHFFRDLLGARTTTPIYYDDPVIGRVSGITDAKLTICYAYLGGYSFELLQYHYPQERGASRLRPCDAGHIHLALKVQGIDQLAARMEQEGFSGPGPIQRGVGAQGIAATYLCGFDQLIVELLEERPA
jgi:catechol 2,3-dioxygenase-like lactoylglutathione lyase family enzyme